MLDGRAVDFAFDETARHVADLSATVLREVGEHSRISQALSGTAGYDETAWKAMAQAGLLGLAVPAQFGGDGLGAVEAATVLTAVGRQAAPVPAFATLALGVLPLVRLGAAEQLTGVADGAVFTAALSALTTSDDGVYGRARAVPYALQAQLILLATDVGIALVSPGDDGVTLTRTTTSTGMP